MDIALVAACLQILAYLFSIRSASYKRIRSTEGGDPNSLEIGPMHSLGRERVRSTEMAPCVIYVWQLLDYLINIKYIVMLL